MLCLSAEADSDRRVALKRKAEVDPHDSSVENSVMDSLVKSWRDNNNPNDDIGLIFCHYRDQYVASVHETGTDRPVCEEPKTPFLLSRRRPLVSWVSGRLSTDLVARLFGTRRVDINKGDEPFYRCRLVVQEYKKSSRLIIFYGQSTIRSAAKFVDLCNNRRASQRGGTTRCME